jgi:hypothetical protein
MSTRSRAQLWKLQEAVRMTGRDRDRYMRLLCLSRAALTTDSHRELWMDYSLADQEYRHAVMQLQDFCTRHDEAVEREPSQQSH